MTFFGWKVSATLSFVLGFLSCLLVLSPQGLWTPWKLQVMWKKSVRPAVSTVWQCPRHVHWIKRNFLIYLKLSIFLIWCWVNWKYLNSGGWTSYFLRWFTGFYVKRDIFEKIEFQDLGLWSIFFPLLVHVCRSGLGQVHWSYIDLLLDETEKFVVYYIKECAFWVDPTGCLMQS